MKSGSKALSIFVWLLFAGQGRLRAEVNLPLAPPLAGSDGLAKQMIDDYQKGRKHAALETARSLANKGDVDALFLIAYAMESPEPARQSRAQAMDYHYRRAAAGGHPEAEFRRQLLLLGSADQNERMSARTTLEATANQGNAKAARILGEAWLRGLCDGKPSFAHAETLWKKSAQAGDTSCLVLLAGLYQGKFGFPERTDVKEAARFLWDAAERDVNQAGVPLGLMLLNGPHDVRDEEQGRGWLAKAIGSGDTRGWLALAQYEETVKQNPATAIEYYRQGAEVGDAECQWQLAHRLADQHLDAQAREWLVAAANQGSSGAAAELGNVLLHDPESDTTSAYPYLLTAARNGVPQAQHDLAVGYLEGRIGHTDEVAAVAWLTEAMKSGDPEAQYKLGTLHEHGIGVPINYANAGVLYTMACTKGHAKAAGRIAHMAMEGLGTSPSPAQAWAHATYALERGDENSRPLLVSLDGKLNATQTAEAEKTLAALRLQKKPERGTTGESRPSVVK